jgi:PAB-dependent poly(A)-specific ribonuclease subunit 3
MRYKSSCLWAIDLSIQLTLLISYADVLEGELAAEVENGRLVRLVSKLGFINERPE